MKTLLHSFLAATVLVASTVRAEPPDQAAEIDALKQRVQDLEGQNRAILRALEELKASLGERGARVPGPGEVATEQPTRVPPPVKVAPPTEIAAEKPTKPAETERQTAEEDRERGFVKWKEFVAGESRFQLYGFLRADTITDTSLPDNAQKPFFIRSPDVPGGGHSNFTLHPRLTRLGLNFDLPRVEHAANGRVGGKLEVDFQNTGSESRQIIRIRHAYLDLSWDDLSLLGGQTWDVISPLYPTVNNDTLMWNAGNLGDRRPQLRLKYEPQLAGGTASFVGALGLTGAVTGDDLDENGVRDGERSTAPNLQGRVGYAHALWRADPKQLAVGLWGLQAFEKTDEAVAGATTFVGQSMGIDYALALSARLSLRGEAWYGRNLDDFRGGIGQGVNLATGDEIQGAGGWAELGFAVTRIYSIYGGYTIDDPRNGDVPRDGRTKNDAWYVVNRFRIGRPLLMGVDYLRWTTNFRGLESATDDRVNLYMQYDF